MNETASVRVRFAPSPTGFLHVGGARTAIFNWLWARHTGGTFVLRIEDTDAERSSAESEASLIEDLKWLGLDWDEGPDVDGARGPYRQSDREEVYRGVAAVFVADGHAYPCFCSDEELEQKRLKAKVEGRPPHYDRTCRDLTQVQIDEKRDAGVPEVIRFRVPDGVVRFADVVRGDMTLDHSMVGDFVIVRSNKLPTYNFAATVDDARMDITHVIRGEEHLSNTLRQILVYDALGAAHPAFVHVPLILAEDRSKLSKRHGAASVEELRGRGFLADAVFNYLTLLGWSHPEAKEVLSREETIEAFDIARIGKAAGVFDPTKLAWMNGQHIRLLSPEAFHPLARPFLPEWLGELYDDAAMDRVLDVLQDAIETLDQLPEQCGVFADPVVFEADAVDVLKDDGAKAVLSAFAAALDALDGELTPEAFKATAKAVGKETGRKGKELFFPLRAAITGRTHGPDLSRTASVKGRERVAHLVAATAG